MSIVSDNFKRPRSEVLESFGSQRQILGDLDFDNDRSQRISI